MRKRIISMLLTAAMVMTLLPTAFAAGETGTKVEIGSVTLENGGIYVPATGNGSEYRVADKFVPTEETSVPEGGIPYIEYKDGTITVHGNITFTSSGPSALTVVSGTAIIAGDSDSSLTLSSTAPAISVNGCLETADNYSGNISISSSNTNAIVGGGDVDLKTSGKISLSTEGTSSLVSAKTLSLEGDITLDAPNASPMLAVSGDISIKDTAGDLNIESNATNSTPRPIIQADGTATLSAPNGNIVINSTGTGYSVPVQAICANDVVIEDTESLQITGNYNAQGISAKDNITFRNCKSVSVQMDNVTALAASGISFENCDSVIVSTESDNYTISGNTEFKGCKSASISTAGTRAIAGQYTCDGRLIITESNVTKIIEDGKEPVITGGDVTSTGLDLSDDEDLPKKETIYAAGSGTITFIPATGTENAKLVLNNAEIDQRNMGRGSAIFFENNVDIEINGTNEFLALNGIISNGTINISGNGKLTVEAYFNTIAADEDVVVNSGTLVLSGQDGIYADKNVTVNGGNITVTPSEDGYGLYAHTGNITINNGEVNISSEAEDVAGIYAYDENNDNGIANIYIHGGTVNIAVDDTAICGFDDIEIDGNAMVTAKSYSSEGIYTSENAKIDGNATVTAISDASSKGIVAINVKIFTIAGNAKVTADGKGNNADITVEKCTVAGSAKLTALAQTFNGCYIAYGICDNNDIVKEMEISAGCTLEVKSGAEFTINAGTGVSILDSSALTLDGKLINNGMLEIDITDVNDVPKGKIVNNGMLLLAFEDDTVDVGTVIRAMELTGAELVYVQTGSGDDAKQDTYTTDGTKLNSISGIDLSDETLSGDLDKDHYHWDKDTKTLTVKDALVGGIVDNLSDDVTIQTEGHVAIGQMQSRAGGTITVTGNSATIMFLHNTGDIIFKDITANVYGIGDFDEDDDDDDQRRQALNTEDNYSYGVTLINSKVTVGGVDSAMIYTKKLTMDDTSVLTLKYAQLECYAEHGLDGIEAYLPKDGGYKIGPSPDEDDDFYTILDANNNIVRDITLKKPETTKPSTGGSGSSGGSAAASYGITVKDSQNGTVTIDRKTASAGSTVTLTVKPNQGWTLETLTVLDASGNKIDLTTVKAGETYTFKMPSGKITIEATFMEDNSILNFFVDVPSDSYFYNAVRWAAEQNVTSGTDDTHFSPAAFCTRAQIVTFLWHAAGSPEPKSSSNPFADVASGSYYQKAVLWAIENGITNGMDDTHFSPDATCTRAQSVTFLYRAAGSAEVSGNAAFSDVAADAYYANAVAWAEQNAVTGGIGDGRFGPNNDCTRAQIVTFLYRMYQNK